MDDRTVITRVKPWIAVLDRVFYNEGENTKEMKKNQNTKQLMLTFRFDDILTRGSAMHQITLVILHN